MTGAAVAQALEEIFNERAIVQNQLEWDRMQGARSRVDVLNGESFAPVRRGTFADRCNAARCGFLVPPVVVDQSEAPSADRSWREGPMARVRRAQVALAQPSRTSSPEGRSSPTFLAEQAGVRALAFSIRGSWTSIASELRAWHMFVQTYEPFAEHFPPTTARLLAFAPHFQNGASLAKYIGAIKFACRWQRIAVEPHVWDVAAAVVRGVRKISAPIKRPAIRLGDLVRIVDQALDEGDVSDARLYIVAYAFLARVRDELIPLQVFGDHSSLRMQPERIVLRLRSRKNEPRGAEIARQCSCRTDPQAPCGVCALAAAVRGHHRRGHSDSAPIFADKSFAHRSRDLRSRCSRIGLTAVGWHAFRRGRAQDMLSSGSTLAQILVAGGWKSAAFLSYLRTRDIDERMSLEAIVAGSDSD